MPINFLFQARIGALRSFTDGEPLKVSAATAPAGEDGFGDVGPGDLYAQVVVDGPEAGVQEIVGSRAR
jgi:hypothetical protein